MSTLTKIAARFAEQRAQTLVIFVAGFTLVTIVGLIVTDFGLWYSERRGAQTDADLPALAGARECMLWMASGETYTPDVTGAVNKWFSENNGGNAELVADQTSTDCFNPETGGACDGTGLCCVDVVVKHKSKNLFSALPYFNHVFDKVAGNIGAHARACAGAANNPSGDLPFHTDVQTNGLPGPCFNDDGTPNLGGMCGLKFGAKAPGNRGDAGVVDLLAPEGKCSSGQGALSDKQVVDLIANGGTGLCLINEDDPPSCDPEKNGPWNDCVAVQQGVEATKILEGVHDRINQPTLCADSFCDAVQPVPGTGNCGEPGTLYEARDCDPNTPGIQTSPRLVNIIVFQNAPDSSSNTGNPILGFAAFFIEGCAWGNDEASLGAMDPNCDYHGSGSLGLAVVYGTFAKLTVAGSGIGPANGSSTEFSIALVDWEGPGGTPGPTATTPAGATDTPVPSTATSAPPTATPPPATATNPPPCPTECMNPAGNCRGNCP